MEEATELEEGEACYYKDGDGNTRTDPDVALSYIDERIQNVLGHFQKDFEGGVSAENLGAKFGGYGSFLPAYERSSFIRSHPKTPQRNHSTPRSPDNLPMEGATQSCTASSNAPPSIRLGISSCSAQSLHISRLPSVDVPVKQDSCLSSARVAENFPLKQETTNKSVNPPIQRKLKVRIKVGSDNTVRKNAAIYSGLGLDISPSSSLGNSPEESGWMLPEYRETSDESPTSILQIMTSFPVGGGLLISPLHDGLLCLIARERLLKDSKPVPAIKGSQEHSTFLIDDSSCKVRDGLVLKEKKTRFVRKNGRLAENNQGNDMNVENDITMLSKKKIKNEMPQAENIQGNGMNVENGITVLSKKKIKNEMLQAENIQGNGMNVENGITVLSKKKIKNETPEAKDFSSSDVKRTPASNSIRDASDFAKGTGWANEKNGMIVDNDITVLSKKKIKNQTAEGKDFMSGDLKLTPSSNSIRNTGDFAKGTGSVNEISWMVNKDGVKGKLSSSDIVKDESFESISGEDSGKSEKLKAKSSSVEKFCQRRVSNPDKDDSVDPTDDGRCKNNNSLVPLKADSDISKQKEDLNVGARNPSKQKVGQKEISHGQNDIEIPYRRGKAPFKGKRKSKEFQSNGKPAADSAEESLRVDFCAASEDKKGTSKSKMHKSQKDIGNVRDNYKDLLGVTYLKQEDKRMDQVERPSGNRSKDSNLNYVEKEWNASFDKSKDPSSHKKVDNQSMDVVSLREAPNAGPPLRENVLTSEVVPAVAPVVIEENWVGCDSCQKWRLLPFGTKPEQLPEKWLCSMLNWLPGMNRCDISEEETTKALNALYQLPVPESQNNLLSLANGTALGVTSTNVRHLDQNHLKLGSHAMPNREKKKHKTKEIPNADSSGLIQISNPTKTHRQESVKSRSLNDMKPLSESSLVRKHLSKSRNLAVEKHIPKQKEKHINGVDAKKTKTKSKREADQNGCEASKKIKTEGLYCADKYWNSEHGGDFGRVSLSSSAGFPAKETGKDLQKYNDSFYYKGTECAAKDRLLVSVKKEEDQAHVSSEGGSSDVKACSKRDVSLKKRKLKDWQDNQNHVETFKTTRHHLPDSKVFMKQESIESEFRKEKKSRVSKTEGKESSTSKGDDRSNKKGRVTRIILSGSRDHPVDDMEKGRSIEKDQQLGKHRRKAASPRNLDGVGFLKRDLGSRQVSMAATSSSSQVSGSHKSKVNFQEMKGSPVESVSSSPLRTFNTDKLTPASGEILGSHDAANGCLLLIGNPRRCLDGEGHGESNRSGTVRKENVSSVLNLKTLEFPNLDYRDGDANNKYVVRTNPSSEFGIGHLVKGDADTLEQHGRYSSDLHALECCHNEDRINNNHFHDNVLFPHKSRMGSSLQPKDKDRCSASEFSRDKMKISDPPGEQEELYSEKSLRYVSEIDPCSFGQCHETINTVKHSLTDKCSIKSSKDDRKHASKEDSLGKWSSDGRKENQLKFGEQGSSDVKLGAPCSTNGNVTPQKKLIQDFECEKFPDQFLAKKIDPIQIESGSGKSQSIMHCEGKKETLAKGVQPMRGSQKGGVFNVLPVCASREDDASEVLKLPGNAGNQNGAYHILGHLTLNQHEVRDFNSSSSVRKDSSNQTASTALKEAKDLRDYADILKSSGFGFESNEAYFQAALKFLHGASLLESCNGDSDKHGEMTQMQTYSTTAKLCEFCAHEYESCQEMAAAALAYKCMEVAYMRVVYYRHFTTSRDRHELQATLQMVPQGESPSSSASDVDNLNNQATVDKAALSKGSGSHVAGHHVNIARNRLNFIRLLDFTQDVNLAMEASRKSQSAFAAANVILKEAQNGEGITAVKRVIDFSFQDVEGLIRLVRLAMEAISRSGFCGSRD